MSEVVERAKKLLRESTAPWRRGRRNDVEGGDYVVALDAPSENTVFYEGLHLVAESIFHSGDMALISEAPEIIAALVAELEKK
jgi:hypothetical protein